MPKLLLTKRNIDSKKHVPPVTEGRVDYFDEEVSGLLLRAGKTSKVFYAFVDVKDPATGSDDLKRRTGLDLTVHGLRRSFISTGERLRLRREDINMLTGYTDHTVTGKHYAKVTPEDLRPVIQMIADTIERHLKESTSNVIQFPGMAKAA